MRVLQYGCGDFFLAHRDNPCGVGHSSFHPKCKSFCSILIYLTDSADGSGATRFHLGGDQDACGADGLGTRHDAVPVVADVVPWRGRAVIFPHWILHESTAIGAGEKYVVRGDVLFSLRETCDEIMHGRDDHTGGSERGNVEKSSAV